MVGQAGEHVEVLERLRVLLASRKLKPEPAKLMCGELAPSEEPERNTDEEREQAHQHRGGRALRLPAEPAEDAPLSVQHGLELASAARLALELELFESRGALEDADELGLGAAKIGGDRGESLDCSRKRRPVLGLEMIVRLPRQHVGKRGAKGYRRKEHARERNAQAQHRAPARGAAGGGVSALNSRWLGRAHAPQS